MIGDALSVAYGAIATWRRRWYAAPGRARRLARPVISIGNLRVGGSGKTPVVAAIARMLIAQGERPVVLSRGYARRKVTPGVTVVSDRERVLVDVEHAGDEPLLLARTLPGVPVLVCAERFAAGTLAESRFDPTVHLLDDGFQHVRLARDIDLLLADESDLDDRVLPAGRLREPLANAAVAHAVIVPGGSADTAHKVGERLGVRQSFRTTRVLGAPHGVGRGAVALASAAPVFAVAAVAKPERFFADLRSDGFNVVGTKAFRDHHWFSVAELAGLADAARRAGASAIVTTEKDAVRLEPLDLSAFPFLAVPLETTIEPTAVFDEWLRTRLAASRAAVH
ncbi:MAG: tetraacyldisaccharide 4'-kinase [Acidobacteria bacterium]|nr:tetraacyldisaccharide 4'-kinase [Acidobacteriota bacterium]